MSLFSLFNKNDASDLYIIQNFFDLYTEMFHPSTVNNCQIKLARKNIILLSDPAVILYKARSRKGIKDRHMKFSLSADNYFVDNFHMNVKQFYNKGKIGKCLKLLLT